MTCTFPRCRCPVQPSMGTRRRATRARSSWVFRRRRAVVWPRPWTCPQRARPPTPLRRQRRRPASAVWPSSTMRLHLPSRCTSAGSATRPTSSRRRCDGQPMRDGSGHMGIADPRRRTGGQQGSVAVRTVDPLADLLLLQNEPVPPRRTDWLEAPASDLPADVRTLVVGFRATLAFTPRPATASIKTAEAAAAASPAAKRPASPAPAEEAPPTKSPKQDRGAIDALVPEDMPMDYGGGGPFHSWAEGGRASMARVRATATGGSADNRVRRLWSGRGATGGAAAAGARGRHRSQGQGERRACRRPPRRRHGRPGRDPGRASVQARARQRFCRGAPPRRPARPGDRADHACRKGVHLARSLAALSGADALREHTVVCGSGHVLL
jgi:hypothetical protein